jgi:hypothetical protein
MSLLFPKGGKALVAWWVPVSQLEISPDPQIRIEISRQGHKCTAEEIAQALCKEGDDWLQLKKMKGSDGDSG